MDSDYYLLISKIGIRNSNAREMLVLTLDNLIVRNCRVLKLHLHIEKNC